MDGKGDNAVIPTVACDKIYRPKCEQELGIRKTVDIHAAFLAKQCWKIQRNRIIFGLS